MRLLLHGEERENRPGGALSRPALTQRVLDCYERWHKQSRDAIDEPTTGGALVKRDEQFQLGRNENHVRRVLARVQ